MAIRFVDKVSRLAKIVGTLDDIAASVTGTHVRPPGRTGVIGAQLDSLTGLVNALFTPAPNRTAQIGVTLDGVSASLTGTFRASTGGGPPTFAPVQPAIAFCGVAGVRTYSDPTQQAAMGWFNLFVMGVSWEGWSSSGRDLDTGVVLPIKAASTAQGGTVLLNYINLNAIEEDANDPRPTWTAEVAARNWRLYVNNLTTLVTPNAGGGGTALVNYTDFVPLNPNGEHPYDFGAKYSYFMCLSKSKSDSRFAGLNTGLASSSLDGVFQDNFLLNPQVNGDWNRDGTTEGQGWPSAPSPWLAAGQLRYVNTMRSLAPSKYVFANAGDYGVTSAGVMVGKLDGLLCESYMGKNWSWETSQPWTTVRDYYYRALASVVNPRMVVFGGSWPDTATQGGAATIPPTNTQDQWATYIAATAYLGEGMPAINRFSQGYSSDLVALDKYWFIGGANGLARGWFGAPIDPLRPTTPKISKGPIGIYGVEYQNAMSLVNPKGNGTQSILASDIPGSWQFPPGSTQGTGTFVSYSMPERSGLFLQRSPASFTDTFSSGNLSHVENGIRWGASANVSCITTRGNPAPSLKFAFNNTTSTAEQRFDLGATYTEWTATYDLYIPDGTEGDGGVAYTHGSLNPANNKFFRIWRGVGTDGNNGYDTAYFKLGASFERGTTVSGMVQSNLQLEYGWNGTVGPAGSNGTGTLAATANNFVTPADRGKWMAIKIYCKCATSANNDGVIQVWKNGVLVASSTNLPCFPSTGAANNGFNYGYHLGFANAGFSSGNINMLIDNMTMTVK